MRHRARGVWIAAAALWAASAQGGAPPESAPREVRLRAQVEFGPDGGEGLGTLFEAFDSTGRPVAAAGFLNACNTMHRSDRRLLQAYVRLPDDVAPEVERLPRPTTDAGVYLLGFQNSLWARSRSGADSQVRRWDPVAGAWRDVDEWPPAIFDVADGVLSGRRDRIAFNDQTLVQLAPGEGDLAELYFGCGRLVWRRRNAAAEPPVNELVAAPWKPGEPPPDEGAWAIAPLSAPSEFIYCYGQRDGMVLAVSNMGGAFALEEGRWRSLRDADPKTSYQVYSSLDVDVRLLLGHYPTGELFEFTRRQLQRRPGWPPVMPGVRSTAREAQTLAIYGGDVYVGVWPWGEVWRVDPHDGQWRWVRRMFSHPAATDAAVHPYEEETKALDPVLNRWGQRVTSLVPWRDSLYIATSAKGPSPYEPKFSFMTAAQAEEYGAVYRYRLPGRASGPVRWTREPTTIEVRWSANELSLWQDGRRIGGTRWGDGAASTAPPARVSWGDGLYGRSPCRVVASPVRAVGREPSPPWLAAYLDLSRICDLRAPVAERERQFEFMLDRFAASGLRIAMPYATTTSGGVYFPSEVGGRRLAADWDALGSFIEIARRKGIETWPAVCVTASGHFEPQGLLVDRPDWALRTPEGPPLGFLSPAHPEVRSYVTAQIRELVARYRPEGVLLDYMRYFNRPYVLDLAADTALERELSEVMDASAAAQARQARYEAYLSSLMEEIAHAVREASAETRIGLYTWGPHVARNHRVAQAWPDWVRRGWVDVVNVSGYVYPEKDGPRYAEIYRNRLREALELAGGPRRRVQATVAIGVQTSHGRLNTGEQLDEYVRLAAEAGLDGAAIFTWSAFEPLAEEVHARRSFDAFRAAAPGDGEPR
jgi:hypothetical protein